MDKCEEHNRYVRNLATILSSEEANELAVERAGKALASVQVMYMNFFS